MGKCGVDLSAIKQPEFFSFHFQYQSQYAFFLYAIGFFLPACVCIVSFVRFWVSANPHFCPPRAALCLRTSVPTMVSPQRSTDSLYGPSNSVGYPTATVGKDPERPSQTGTVHVCAQKILIPPLWEVCSRSQVPPCCICQCKRPSRIIYILLCFQFHSFPFHPFALGPPQHHPLPFLLCIFLFRFLTSIFFFFKLSSLYISFPPVPLDMHPFFLDPPAH